MRFRFFRAVISDLLFVPLVLFCIFNASLVMYGLRMGKGQASIVLGARPVKEVIADPATPDSIRRKLQLIEDIRRFAFDSIGLSPNENYTTFYDQHGKRLIYVVTACRPYELKAHLWHFPVLGDVPYKGFFDPKQAEEEVKRLQRDGWDTDVGGASGWSTLGWFKDPVLSQMLSYDEGELAELIIHELTHGTLFVKDSVDYNENLASFIGYKGALWFLESKYGKDSKQLTAYLNDRHDEAVLDTFMLRSARSADSLYKAIANQAAVAKQQQKERLFASFIAESRRLPLAGDTLFPGRFEKRLHRSGNTLFMQSLRYGARQQDFEKEYARYAGLREFLAAMKTKYGVPR